MRLGRIASIAASIATTALLLGAALAAQTAAGTSDPLALAAATTTAAVPASYVVEPNDVLSLRVYGAPELDAAQMRVDRDGTIHTPFGHTPVHVSGLTVPAIRKAVAAELVADHLAVDPRVEVAVVAVGSHPILVTGPGVRRPGVIQAIAPMRLLDVLAQAGGLSGNSSEEITIIKRGANGIVHVNLLSASEVLRGSKTTDNPWLDGGEEVRVVPGGFAYVAGSVKSPGAFALSDTDPLTIRKALAKAHGLTNFARAGSAQLVRNVGSGAPSTIMINLPAILNGTQPDITLAANDLIYVPDSTGKKATLSILSHAMSALTLAAADLLVR